MEPNLLFVNGTINISYTSTSTLHCTEDVWNQLRHMIGVLWSSVNIIVHIVGVHLLTTTFKRRNKTQQHLHLINRSVVELMKNVSWFVQNIFPLICLNEIRHTISVVSTRPLGYLCIAFMYMNMQQLSLIFDTMPYVLYGEQSYSSAALIALFLFFPV